MGAHPRSLTKCDGHTSAMSAICRTSSGAESPECETYAQICGNPKHRAVASHAPSHSQSTPTPRMSGADSLQGLRRCGRRGSRPSTLPWELGSMWPAGCQPEYSALARDLPEWGNHGD